MKRLYIFISIIFAFNLLSLSLVHAVPPWPNECQIGSLPSYDPNYPNDQLILTCVPENWNGQLVVYAHGYVPAQEPLSLPIDELTVTLDGVETTIPDILLPLGFAFATSSYHKNGYAVEQAGADLNALVDYFTHNIVPAQHVSRVYIVGASEGGLIATMLLERKPEIYHGGLALCGPVSGAPYQVRYMGDFRVVFDYFFPYVFPFGVANVPEDAFMYWENIYGPLIAQGIGSHLRSTNQLFNVTKAARDPVDPLNTAVETALEVLSYSIWETNDLIDVAGGEPYGNLFTWYSGSKNDFALNANVERVQANPAARAYIKKFYETKGFLKRPLVTLHTTLDGMVPFSHELIYLTKVAFAGRSRFLTILPVPRYGHCTFTIQELLGAFALLVTQSKGQMSPMLGSYLRSLPAPLR